MSTITGKVTNGVVVPTSPLPEGAHVEIHMIDAAAEISPELREELAAWQQGSAEALALVERLAGEEGDDKKGDVWRVRHSKVIYCVPQAQGEPGQVLTSSRRKQPPCHIQP